MKSVTVLFAMFKAEKLLLLPVCYLAKWAGADRPGHIAIAQNEFAMTASVLALVTLLFLLIKFILNRAWTRGRSGLRIPA